MGWTQKMLDRFSLFDLIIIAMMEALGIAIKPVVVPLAHIITGPLFIPSGAVAGGFYMMWLVLGFGLTGKRGTAFLIGNRHGYRRFSRCYEPYHLYRTRNYGRTGALAHRPPGLLHPLFVSGGHAGQYGRHYYGEFRIFSPASDPSGFSLECGGFIRRSGRNSCFSDPAAAAEVSNRAIPGFFGLMEGK